MKKGVNQIVANQYASLAKASELLPTLIRPINGTAMNSAIISVGFSQRVKDIQKCGFSQI